MTLRWIERYKIHGNAHGGGWAVVHIDSKGFLGIVSDYGNWAFHWSSFGKDFKQFLTELDWAYLHGKLTMGHRRVYDGEETVKLIKNRIRELRRRKAFDSERARREWDLITEHDVASSDIGFARWYDDTSLDDAAEFHCTEPEPQCRVFCQQVWPKFVEAMQAGLYQRLEPKAGKWHRFRPRSRRRKGFSRMGARDKTG